MNIINLYQCEYCGKESRNKEKIEKHEELCSIEHARKTALKVNIDKWSLEFRENFNPDKIPEMINEFLEKTVGDSFKIINFRLSYSDCVSNSHSRPINGVENFSRKDDKPKGYPGFHGRIEGGYSKSKKSISEYTGGWHNTIDIPGLHTGTGGGGNESWGYQFHFFLQDFPNLEKEILDQIKTEYDTYIIKRAKAELMDQYCPEYQFSRTYEQGDMRR